MSSLCVANFSNTRRADHETLTAARIISGYAFDNVIVASGGDGVAAAAAVVVVVVLIVVGVAMIVGLGGFGGFFSRLAYVSCRPGCY